MQLTHSLNIGSGTRLSTPPVIMKALHRLQDPFAPSWQIQDRNQEYTAAFALDKFRESSEEPEATIAATGLKLHQAVQNGKLDAGKASVAMQQILTGLKAGLPTGPLGSVVAHVGSQAYQAAREDVRDFYNGDFSGPKQVAETFTEAVAQLDGGAAKIASAARSLASTVKADFTTGIVHGNALKLASTEQEWSETQSLAWLAHETMSDPLLSLEDAVRVGHGATTLLAHDSSKAQEAISALDERTNQAQRDLLKEPVHYDFSPALGHLTRENYQALRGTLEEIFQESSDGAVPEKAPDPVRRSQNSREVVEIAKELLRAG